MYSVVQSFDKEHLCITYHKTREEAEKRRDLEGMLIAEWLGNPIIFSGIFTNYKFKREFPQFFGLQNYRKVHPIIQEKLDKINGELIEIYDHHPFCNSDPRKPVEDCNMCKRFFEEYGDMPVEEIMKKHFPDVKVRK